MAPEITVNGNTIKVSKEVAEIAAGAIQRAAEHNYDGEYITPEVTIKRNQIGKNLHDLAVNIRSGDEPKES
jgi:uncharacterized protein with ACT and thioredoxin-like domain